MPTLSALRDRSAPLIREAANLFRLLILRGSGVGATFLMSLLIVRRFGVEVNGLFQVALSYVMIGAAVARLGQEQLALREIAAMRVRDDGRSARAAIDLSLAVTLPVGIVTAAIFAGGAMLLDPGGGGMLPAFAPTIVMLTGLWIVTEALRGWQLVPASVFWQGCFIPVAFVLAFLLLDAAGWLAPEGLAPLYGVCGLVALAGSTWSWRQAIGDHVTGRPSTSGGRGMAAVVSTMRSSATFWMLAIFTSVAGWLDLLVLYAFADAAVVGTFQPIVRTGGLIAVAINIVATGLVARLAYLYADGDGVQFVRLARGYWLAITAGSLVAGATFIVAAPWIAAAWGPKIAPYAAELSLYVLIQIFQAIFIIAPLAAPVMGLERAALVVQIANVPLKAVAVGVGYAHGGLTGVILGIGFCTLVTVLWTVVLFFRQLAAMGIRWQSFLTGRL